MKSGMPWSLKGVDEETREAIYEAARRAGLSVSEWLNSNVGGAERDTGRDGPAVIAASLERLAGRVRSMDDTSRAAVPGLSRRLGEIERVLDGLSEGRSGNAENDALKGVSSMIEKLARDIEDADERARTMIEGQRAARPPHADVGRVTDAIRDLDQRIATMSERIASSREERTPPLDDIRHRLNSLLAERPKAPARDTSDRAATIDAALRALETRIDDAKARLISPRSASNAPPPPKEADLVARIERRLDDLGARLSDRTASPRAAQPVNTDDLAAAIAEISTHQKALDQHAEDLATRRDQSALSATMAALRADIAGLSEQVALLGRSGAQDQSATFDLARRIEALSTDRPLDRSLLTSMRADLTALRETIEQQDGAISEQLGSLARLAPDHTRLDALGEEVSALRHALESDDSPRAVQRLEMRMAELGRSLEGALSGRGNGNADIDRAIQRLEERLDDIGRDVAARLAEPAATAEVDRIEGRLDEIATRVDALLDRTPAADSMATMQARLQSLIDTVEGLAASHREPTAALDEIKTEIAAIRHDIAGRGAPDTAHLETQIRELADRLDSATSAGPEGTGLAELEAQVARLATQLVDDQPRAEALRTVEGSLEKLQDHLSRNHIESIEAARAEARAAVKELAASGAGSAVDSDLIRSLRQDLDSLRAAASIQQPAETPDALGQTLSQVAERIGQLERVANADVAPAAERSSATPSQSKAAPDRRADFIAAARRAAQAAADAARTDAPGADSETDEPAERKSGAFARISQAIRNRNKPLLLAAAAIVLAIGAMQIYSKFIDTGETPARLAAEAPSVPPARVAVTAATQSPSVDDILAAAGATSAARNRADAAMVAPSTKPDANIAFAAPEAVGNGFGAPASAPPTETFGDTAKAETAPVTLASSPKLPEPTALNAGPAPDPAIGSDKLVAAAATGDPAAAFEIAARYAEGDRVPKDLAKAAEWYARSAEGGVAVAQYRLGSLYERGQGVAKSPIDAVNWYQRASDQGNVNAMHNLAVMMSEGVDGAPDQQKALQWFLAAADYGVRDSQYNLGVIYARGLGTPQDLTASYKWFAIAAAQGDTDASGRRDEVAKLLPADDLAKARAAVQAWHAKPPLAEANGVSTPEGGWDGPGKTLGEGDRQALVKKIQTLLAEQGFDPGPTDGVIGEKTRDAVRAYQRRNGIAETGRIDGSLVAALSDSRL